MALSCQPHLAAGPGVWVSPVIALGAGSLSWVKKKEKCHSRVDEKREPCVDRVTCPLGSLGGRWALARRVCGQRPVGSTPRTPGGPSPCISGPLPPTSGLPSCPLAPVTSGGCALLQAGVLTLSGGPRAPERPAGVPLLLEKCCQPKWRSLYLAFGSEVEAFCRSIFPVQLVL